MNDGEKFWFVIYSQSFVWRTLFVHFAGSISFLLHLTASCYFPARPYHSLIKDHCVLLLLLPWSLSQLGNPPSDVVDICRPRRGKETSSLFRDALTSILWRREIRFNTLKENGPPWLVAHMLNVMAIFSSGVSSASEGNPTVSNTNLYRTSNLLHGCSR